jgi:hypothetical protein
MSSDRIRTSQATAIHLATHIAEMKAEGLVPSTLPKLMTMLRRDIKEPFNKRAVQQVCEHLNIRFLRKRAKATRKDSYLRGKQAKSVAHTMRQLVVNIEECLGIDSGELLQNGVHEALVRIAAGKNVDSDFFDSTPSWTSVDTSVDDAPGKSALPSPNYLAVDSRTLGSNMPEDDCGIPRGITQPHARAANGSGQ